MRKVYKVIVAGVIEDIGVKYSENVIDNNKDNALSKITSNFTKVWCSNIKLNLKETIKLAILDSLNLESIVFNKRRICKNCKLWQGYCMRKDNINAYDRPCGHFDFK